MYETFTSFLRLLLILDFGGLLFLFETAVWTSFWNNFFWYEKKKVKTFFSINTFIKNISVSSKKIEKKRLNRFFDGGEFRLLKERRLKR